MKKIEMAETTGTTIEDVDEAMRGAEKYDVFGTQRADGSVQTRTAWFVSVRSQGAFGHQGDRVANAVGRGDTRQEAVLAALRNRQNWR